MHSNRDFDKRFKSVMWFNMIAGIIGLAVSGGILAFMGWVIIKMMQHFSII